MAITKPNATKGQPIKRGNTALATKVDGPASPAVNEQLADQIEKEWMFKVKRAPETFVTRLGIVIVVLLVLEVMLIVSNNVYYLGWEWFIERSTSYRDELIRSQLGLSMHLGSSWLAPFSLWRGWVVPTVLAGSTYVVVSLITLRHELYHWKPELLEYYMESGKASAWGRHIPSSWWSAVFDVYAGGHHKNNSSRIQKRQHVAMEDARQFVKVLRVVGYNIYISGIMFFFFWLLLLRTNIDADAITRLPRSFVPPVQAMVWYLFNDLFYFYPHWIAHYPPSVDGRAYRLLPKPVAAAVHTHFRTSHKLHHRTKANLGMAAWYCSPWEQILFNVFPALVGPYVTQVLADAFHVEHIWGTHLVTLYIWLMAGAAMSVLAHTGYRSRLNDPGKHDLHHERAFNPTNAVNFGTLGFFDWVHGTGSAISKSDTKAWRNQHSRQAALYEASRRSGIPLTKEQKEVVKQPEHDAEWIDKSI